MTGTKGKVRRFQDLIVWQKAKELSDRIFRLARRYPPEEKFRLADNSIRAIDSVKDNIAEGFGRFHFKDKLNFYNRASASLDETQNHVLTAESRRYITEVDAKDLHKDIEFVRLCLKRMIGSLLRARNLYAREQRHNL